MVSHPHLRIHLLGVPQVWVAGQALDTVRWQRPLTLLAYLAVESDREHPREILAELFWPDRPQSDGLRNLRQLLHRLRRAIADDGRSTPHLLSDGPTLRFHPASDVFVDVLALRRLGAATATHAHRRLAACPTCAPDLETITRLYRGRFLSGWDLTDSPDLETWALLTHESLMRDTHVALHALTERHLAHGDADQALAYAQRLLSFDPWDEAAERLLLRAYAAGGSRNRALREAARFREQLASELNLPLEDETEALLAKIRAGEEPDALPHDPALPLATAPLYGRRREIAEVTEALTRRDRRLVTLLGPGGSGKTRLALHVVKEQAPDWRHGVAFVSLAEVTQQGGETSVAQAMLTALDVVIPRGQSVATALLGYLRGREMLLVLDNCEHLLAAASRLVRQILGASLQAKVMVTSQARLNLPEEWIVHVQGLSLSPSLDGIVNSVAASSAQELGADGAGEVPAAVALFTHHARRVKPGWELTGSSRACVDRICHIVAGLPLALELAAAWVRTASVCRLADEISRNLNLLQAASPHRPDRHQSIAAVFDYAYKLLSEPDRRLLRRLAIFPASFTMDAAREVADATLPSLARLLDRSLVRLSETERWDLHPLLRNYASERLATDPAAADLRVSHAIHYLAWLRGLESALWGPAPQSALSAISVEWENIRLAWGVLLSADPPTEELCRLLSYAAAPLARYLDLTGQFLRGTELFDDSLDEKASGSSALTALLLAHRAHFLMRRACYEEALTLALRAAQAVAGRDRMPATEALALALLVQGTVRRHAGDFEAAEKALSEALQVCRDHRLHRTESEVLRTLGALHWRRSEYDDAVACYEAALATDRALADRRGEGWTLNGLGLVAENQGRYGLAVERYRRALALVTEIGDLWGQSIVHGNLGYIYARIGDAGSARIHYRRDLAICRSLGDRRGEAWTQGYLSLLAHQEGNHRAALRHALRSLTLAREIDHAPLVARALTHAGHAWDGLGMWAEAESAYREALELRRAAGEAPLAMETRAGLIRVALGRGQIAMARDVAEDVLTYLAEYTADRTDEHLRIYLACYRALAAAEDDRATAVLRDAHALLHQQAARIQDPALRAAYLDDVAVHRDIQALYAEL